MASTSPNIFDFLHPLNTFGQFVGSLDWERSTVKPQLSQEEIELWRSIGKLEGLRLKREGVLLVELGAYLEQLAAALNLKWKKKPELKLPFVGLSLEFVRVKEHVDSEKAVPKGDASSFCEEQLLLHLLETLLESYGLQTLSIHSQVLFQDGQESFLLSVSAKYSQKFPEGEAFSRENTSYGNDSLKKNSFAETTTANKHFIHQLHNKLAGIVSFASLIRHQNKENPELQDSMNQILEAAGEAKILITQGFDQAT